MSRSALFLVALGHHIVAYVRISARRNLPGAPQRRVAGRPKDTR